MTLTQDRPGHAIVPAPRTQAPSTSTWRTMLERRWRDRLRQLTEHCVAFHESGSEALGEQPRPSLRRLMRQSVVARQALGETEAALGRLTLGTFGRCEDCAVEIPAANLAVIPETRHCPSCAAC
jgi:RNA polymerase-binding transcription factor DksA